MRKISNQRKPQMWAHGTTALPLEELLKTVADKQVQRKELLPPHDAASLLIYDPQIHFVSIPVVADFLGLAKSTVYAAAHSGEICEGVPVVTVGKRYLVATAHLRALIEKEK